MWLKVVENGRKVVKSGGYVDIFVDKYLHNHGFCV